MARAWCAYTCNYRSCVWQIRRNVNLPRYPKPAHLPGHRPRRTSPGTQAGEGAPAAGFFQATSSSSAQSVPPCSSCLRTPEPHRLGAHATGTGPYHPHHPHVLRQLRAHHRLLSGGVIRSVSPRSFAKRLDSPASGYRVSQLINPLSLSNAAKFSATLSWQEQRITVLVLIDCWYAQEKRLPLVLLEIPLSAFALDGNPMGPITHRTQPLTLTVSVFILGRPWLELHTPHICWRSRCILSWSTTCHARCLRGTQTPSRVERPRPTPPNLSSIPPEYHDLGEGL